ncbi:hypothetical protein I302_105001 [Kwoniella bestiolae CBS 10118]|uniref:protein-tyrosine-phosphatase n=1 Tax=Kwoniella bestiolae CBS 10118 TaxID=1296100 RepID=A0A1B9FR62_9TREE|nr:hypothetical protein I302_08927 [Kwoniella bestiolae CBS 10118]OCF21255.1 hypothetical protein I302_08927 [Kwoniella bestiolae CBS 10118]
MSTQSQSPKRSSQPYRSTPPPPPPAATNGISSSTFYPGFLGVGSREEEFTYVNGSPSSSASSSRSSSPGLPYLVDSPQPTSAKQPFPSQAKASSPTKSKIKTNGTFPARSKSTPLGLEIGREKSPVGTKRRPVPLNLGKARETVGLDEEIVIQRDEMEANRPMTASSVMSDSASSLSNELQDLSLLRKTVRQNLRARPLDSPLPASDSEKDSSGFPTPDFMRTSQQQQQQQPQSLSVFEGETINVDETLRLLQTSPQLLIIDTRPLGSFLDSHLPRSANISIPSLIFKRLRKSPGGQGTTNWESLGGFVSTQAGRSVWDGLETDKHLDVVLVGLTAMDELAKVLYGIIKALLEHSESTVKVLKGGWTSVLSSSNAQDVLVCGENSTSSRPSLATSLPPPKSAPAYDVSPVPPPIPPSSPPRALNQRPSMPSLRPDNTNRRNLPSLSITGGSGTHMNGPSTSRRTPKLSLNLDKPLKSATIGSFNLDNDRPPPTPGAGFIPKSKSDLLSVNTHTTSTGIKSPRSPGFTLNIPKSPNPKPGSTGSGSFQTLCYEQSKLPPSPSSFGDVKHLVGRDEDMVGADQPKTPLPGQSWGFAKDKSNSDLEEGAGAGKNGIAPFIVSTILPSFLYLGPEITSTDDVNHLKKLGVKRILNVALECDDDATLKLRDNFDRYHRIPMRDIVEESGVGRGMRESCGFLDDARLHSAPTYVHCKAGKSRSVTVVLAYLIHANAWTLKTSYAYVAERRKGISPNIGFVAELMQFEESELGLKQSGGVHGDSSNGSGHGHSSRSRSRNGGEEDSSGEEERRKSNNRTRESLPPTWSHSLDITSSVNRISPIEGTSKEGEGRDKKKGEEDADENRRQVGDEREVRKNGQWVHHRRAPVDRTTLQPGRRVSKAGLESLRPLNTTSITTPKPSPSPGLGQGSEYKDRGIKHSVTPAGDGPLKWV